MAFTQMLVEGGDTGDLPVDAVQPLSNGEAMVAVITASAHPGETWDARLREAGLTRRELARHSIPLRGVPLTVQAWSIEQVPPDGLVFGPPLLTIGGASEDAATPGPPRTLAPRERFSRPAVAIPSSASGTWARIRVETPGGVSWCRLALQDENGGALISTLCTAGTRYVLLPALTKSVTVALDNPSNRPSPMPVRIDVALAGSAD
jgi:hypothetical protein